MEKLNWDLENILENNTLDKLFNDWEKQMKKILILYKDFISNLNNFKKWLHESDILTKLSNRLSNYISNKSNEDITNQLWIGWSQKVDQISNEFSVQLSNYDNIIIENERKIKIYLEDKEIQEYGKSFDSLFRYKPHILSESEEKIISKISNCTSGVDEMYNSLIDSDIKFSDAKDKNNKLHKINTISDVTINLKNKDRDLRKSTWISFNKAFYDFRGTLTHSLYYNYLTLNTYSKINNFKDYVHASAFNDEIDVELILHIYDQVSKYKETYNKFNKHKSILLKGLLNIKKIEPWDLSLDLSKSKVTFEIAEAKDIVLKSLKPMGTEYLEVVKKIFNENWISWLPKKNKHSGAYSIGGTKGLNKYYILMNYDKTLNSVYTLIHEIGHSINSYYYTKSQKIYQGTSIFCAEIASITNEMLLNHYLLKKYKDDKKMKLVILDELISGFYSTTTRQIIFSNFEYNMNLKINNNESFTYDIVEEEYKKLVNKYIGYKNIEKYSKEPYKWSLVTPLRIPHFYVGNFYVYKYAIGQVVACIIANRIINGEKNAVENYINFLKSGTSLNPIDTIKLLDIDLSSEETWKEANDIIDIYINDFLLIKKI